MDRRANSRPDSPSHATVDRPHTVSFRGTCTRNLVVPRDRPGETRFCNLQFACRLRKTLPWFDAGRMTLSSRQPPEPRERQIVADAPAKLNLGLEVIGRREDGLHEIATIFV